MNKLASQKIILQTILLIIISIVFGWLTVTVLNGVDIKKIILLLMSYFAILFFVIFNRSLLFNLSSKPLLFLMYLLILSAFIGPAFLSIKAGPISIFPYRVFILFIPLLLVFLFFRNPAKYFSPFLRQSKKNIYIHFLLVWIVYSFVSLFWAESLKLGLYDIIFLGTGVMLIILMTYFLNNSDHFKGVYYLWLAISSFILLLGLINHFLNIHLPISRIYSAPSYQKGIPTSIFVNENDYASFISISFFFILSFVYYTKKQVYKFFGIGALFTSLLLIALTYSRANYIAIGAGFLFWFVFLADSHTKKNLLKYSIGGVAILGIVAFDKISALFWALYEQLNGMFLSNSYAGGSVDIRHNLIKNAFLYFENSYGFGIGAGNIEYYLKEYEYFPVYSITNVHNWWVQLAVNYGIFIFMGFIILYIALITHLYKTFKDSTSTLERMISSALICSLISFIFASVSPSSMMGLNYTWLMLGFSISFLSYKKNWGKTEENQSV